MIRHNVEICFEQQHTIHLRKYKMKKNWHFNNHCTLNVYEYHVTVYAFLYLQNIFGHVIIFHTALQYIDSIFTIQDFISSKTD